MALEHPVAFYATGSVLADVASRLPDRPGVNYLVFVDFALPVLQAAAGSWAQDDSPWATNVANLTAHSRYAYLQAGGEDFFGSEQPASQYADQVLHEVLHTLGAVQPSAPHFSGGAHCYQLFDVMCYTPRDGTSDGFLRDCELGRTAPNPGKPLDCGGDDYFNASPAPGSYLAAHWNLYDSGFLCTLGRCDQPPVAPAARLAVVAGDGQSVTVSAASSADPDGAVVSYVWDLDGDGVYDTAGPAAQTVAVAGRDAQRLTVAAVDNDNLVATATITVDEHSVPGQVGAPVAIPGHGDAPGTIATPLPSGRGLGRAEDRRGRQPRRVGPQVAASPSAAPPSSRSAHEGSRSRWPHRVTFMSVSRCAAAPVSWRAAGSPPRGARGASRCA